MLGCVYTVNSDWVIPLAAGGYLSRLHNTLSKFNPDIDDVAIRQRWLTRDVEVLKNSKRTNLVNLLTDYIAQSKFGDAEHPQALDYKIVLNTYPYELSKAEVKEFFICLKSLLGVDHLTRIHSPISELTPEYISANYNRFMLYDFNEWLMLHGSNLVTQKMPLVTCVVPLCYLPGMEDQREENEAQKWISAGFASALDVEFVPLADMSIRIPDGYNFEDEVR